MQFDSNSIILYPTDTIYGLGVDATNTESLLHLKELKGREEEKHISIIVSDIEMMRQYAEVTPLAEKLIEKFLPGKLTIVLKSKQNLSKELSSDGTIGIRMIDSDVVSELIQVLDRPITATSANVSGKSTENTPRKILEQFGDRASMITRVIDVGELSPSKSSTVVDARGEKPVIIREGAIPKLVILENVM